ncbi:MAG: HlyD family efflux transporter periplasmic adaptor subunit [Bacteroidales bacterium]|jgi:HlyD family secretion protein|nr:HlyD family efflux transporter periplasmic adaptor subunit [Bacteroidales bacterium]
MKTKLYLLLPTLLIASCHGEPDRQADAWGNFEAVEVIISAETAGPVLYFNLSEGMTVDAGDEIALIDTTLLHLQKAEIDAGMRSVYTRIAAVEAQNDILREQIKNLNVNITRIDRMLKDDAATQKQFDDLSGQVAVLEKQIAANNTQKASIAAELSVMESRKALVNEQLARSLVKSPVKGTIIEKYSEAGELTTAGRPLVKIADLTVMKLRVYVSGAQLGNVRIGNECTVRIDDGKKGYLSFTGTISNVSEKAEFTPKIIQTKEERVILVYAVTIDVANDGTIKSGMPGEAIF